jgi:hypothetical protein
MITQGHAINVVVLAIDGNGSTDAATDLHVARRNLFDELSFLGIDIDRRVVIADV